MGEDYTFNSHQVIDSKYYGVPQQRKRAIFLLVKKGINKVWEFPEQEKKVVTLRDAIGDLPSLANNDNPFIIDQFLMFYQRAL